MIVELLQLWKIVSEGVFYYLPLHMMLFVFLPLILRGVYSRKYVPFHSLKRKVNVSVIIPEYGEDLNIFERCLASVARNNPDEIIVVHDDGRKEVAELAERYGAKVYSFPKRVGKRRALVQGWIMASGEIIVHVDSDVALHDGAIREIVKPFDDEEVVGVQGKNLVNRTHSWFAWRLSKLIELNRDLNNKALNGHLVVVDGRFNAWRRNWLLKHKTQFLGERFLGLPCEIGDDRFLTARANAEGYKTVYQETAVAETASPTTYIKFVKQQLRWRRSGYKAFFKDFYTGVASKVSWLYLCFQICLYTTPISFTFAIIHDVLFAPPVLLYPIWMVIPIAIIGSSIISLVRRLAVGFTEIGVAEFFALGATAIFIMYPISLYALLTIRKQTTWGTR